MAAADLFEPTWSSLLADQKVDVVLKDVIWDGHAAMGVSCPGEQAIRISGNIPPEAVGFPRVTVLAATFVRLSGLVDLHLGPSAVLLPHRPVLHEDVLNYVELCAGMGATAFGFSKVGFHQRCAVEWQSSLVASHQRVHPGVPTVHADICLADTVARIYEVWPDPCTLMAGISCQPYSRGGLGHGGDDERSATLPATLRIMHMLQAPVLVIECVTQAQTNAYVAEHVELLRTKLGFHVSQCRMRLENVWAACRYRWWLVACHPALGAVAIPPQPSESALTVRDVMPYVLRWPSEVENQLQLTDVELEKFQMHGRHLRQFLVQPGQKLPTALHSWGGQVLGCACGCRDSGFSDGLLEARGLYAQILQFTQSDGTVVYRHLHAIEVAMLCGVPPKINWSDNERLNLCAIGQMAAPMQSVWIAASIVRHLQRVFTVDTLLEPMYALNELKHQVYAESKLFFADVPKTMPPPPVSAKVLEVSLSGGVKVQVVCGPACTVRDLIWAECDLRHIPVFELVAFASGFPDPLPLDFPLRDLEHVDLRDVNQDDKTASPHDQQELECPFADDGMATDLAPTLVDGEEPATGSVPVVDVTMSEAGLGLAPSRAVDSTISALLNLSPSLLLDMLPPLVGDPSLLHALRAQVIDHTVRTRLLEMQQHVWGDDEILWHLQNVIVVTSTHDTLVLDPLLASSWLRVGNVDWVRTWLPADGMGNRIVTAVLSNGHWTPFLWVKKVSSLEVLCWDHDDVDMNQFNPLHGLLCQALDLPMFRVACARRSFGLSMCGAASIGFVLSSLSFGNLPHDEASLVNLQHKLKQEFHGSLAGDNMVFKPWCWGAGVPDVQSVLANLLQFHGVPQQVSVQRARLVMQSLGRDPVQNAIGGVSPWKTLKQLANRHTPVVQLVLPDELAAATQAKKVKGDVKSTKKQGIKHAPPKPADVDPTRLHLTEESFCLPDGTPVRQIPLTQVGPLATGIALVHYSDALQFLHSGKVLTSKGLALLAINGPTDIQSDLPWSSIRFAATCAANNQPVLLSGLLVQLGQTTVGPFRSVLFLLCRPFLRLVRVLRCSVTSGLMIGIPFVNIQSETSSRYSHHCRPAGLTTVVATNGILSLVTRPMM